MAHAIFIATVIMWGSSFILMKKAAPAFGPIGVGAYRLIIGAGALMLIVTAQRRRWPMKREHVGGMALVAVVSYAWPFALQPYLIARHGSALMGMIVSLVPLLTVVASIPLLRVYPSRREVIGVAAGFVFVVLLLGEARRALSVPLTDLALALTVPINYAIANTYVKRRFADVPAMPLTAGALGLAGAILLPLHLSFETVDTRGEFGAAALSLALLGVLCTGVAYYLFYRMVQRRGPLYAGMVGYLIPLVAMAWARGDREPLTVIQVVSVVGVLASVAIVQLPKSRRLEAGAVLPQE